MTYQELNHAANRLARHLVALGVEPDSRVALCFERSVDMVVGMLATLKAGGAYVPLDPAYPRERLAYMLQDSQPVAVLTHAATASLLDGIADSRRTIRLDVDGAAWADQSDGNLDLSGLSPDHLAYVIYTSGSTGQPKGVMVTHRNLGNLIAWHNSAFGLCAGQRASSTAGVAFDACTWEVWPPLCAGAQLCLPPAAGTDKVLEWWQQTALDVSFLVTPLAEHAWTNGQDNAGLRHLLIGGDRLRRAPSPWPKYEVVNNYGPTETTVVATSGRLQPDDAVLHIGRPIANTRIYLLDAHLQQLPIGVAGEIYIGGAGVARGYLNRAELTQERFLPDPFCAQPNARMYKTGDLGRYLADGNIEYLGRNDFQVKIRGFRIELGEIEAALLSAPNVREAAVLAREDVPGDKRLVAYVAGEVDVDALRAQLEASLAPYMVPSAFVRMDALPLTPNGKLDRKTLPVPDGEPYRGREYEAPEDEIELSLAAIWSELLGRERIGRHDNFFELGGHSLLAIQAMTRVTQEFEVDLPLDRLFANPTIATLNDCIVEAQLAQFDASDLERLMEE